MHESEAKTIFAFLHAGCPGSQVTGETMEVYTRSFERLADPHRLYDAVQMALESNTKPFLPSLGCLREVYFSPGLRDKYMKPQLEQADALSDSWREENMRRLSMMSQPGGLHRLMLEMHQSGELDLTEEQAADAKTRAERGDRAQATRSI